MNYCVTYRVAPITDGGFCDLLTALTTLRYHYLSKIYFPLKYGSKIWACICGVSNNHDNSPQDDHNNNIIDVGSHNNNNEDDFCDQCFLLDASRRRHQSALRLMARLPSFLRVNDVKQRNGKVNPVDEELWLEEGEKSDGIKKKRKRMRNYESMVNCEKRHMKVLVKRRSFGKPSMTGCGTQKSSYKTLRNSDKSEKKPQNEEQINDLISASKKSICDKKNKLQVGESELFNSSRRRRSQRKSFCDWPQNESIYTASFRSHHDLNKVLNKKNGAKYEQNFELSHEKSTLDDSNDSVFIGSSKEKIDENSENEMNKCFGVKEEMRKNLKVNLVSYNESNGKIVSSAVSQRSMEEDLCGKTSSFDKEKEFENNENLCETVCLSRKYEKSNDKISIETEKNISNAQVNKALNDWRDDACEEIYGIDSALSSYEKNKNSEESDEKNEENPEKPATEDVCERVYGQWQKKLMESGDDDDLVDLKIFKRMVLLRRNCKHKAAQRKIRFLQQLNRTPVSNANSLPNLLTINTTQPLNKISCSKINVRRKIESRRRSLAVEQPINVAYRSTVRSRSVDWWRGCHKIVSQRSSKIRPCVSNKSATNKKNYPKPLTPVPSSKPRNAHHRWTMHEKLLNYFYIPNPSTINQEKSKSGKSKESLESLTSKSGRAPLQFDMWDFKNHRNENKSAKRVDKSVEEVEHLVMKDGMLVEFVVPVLKDNNTTHPTPPQHDHNLSHRKNKNGGHYCLYKELLHLKDHKDHLTKNLQLENMDKKQLQELLKQLQRLICRFNAVLKELLEERDILKSLSIRDA